MKISKLGKGKSNKIHSPIVRALSSGVLLSIDTGQNRATRRALQRAVKNQKEKTNGRMD
jgi:hypothetical protein